MAIPCRLHGRPALGRAVMTVTAAVIRIRLHRVESTVQQTAVPGGLII
jgi:hypothetical protein